MNSLVWAAYDLLQLVVFGALSLLPGGKGDKRSLILAGKRPSSFLQAVRQAKPTGPTYWLHVASAGELEQAVPVARALHEGGGVGFFVTYFSPSARPFLTQMPGMVGSAPFPRDNPKLFTELLTHLGISRILIVRYDFWPGMFAASRRLGVPIALLAATSAPARAMPSVFVPLQRRWKEHFFAQLSHAFFLAPVPADLGSSFPSTVCLHAGDPKWARAKERAERVHTEGWSLYAGRLVQDPRTSPRIVAGSPHREDTDALLQLLRSVPPGSVRLIVAPHEPQEAGALLERCAQTGHRCGRIAQAAELLDVVIVDRVGLLAELYALGDIALIGGGFGGSGLHNALEAAAHGTPTVFGPCWKRSPEAGRLVSQGAAVEVGTPEELTALLQGLGSPETQTLLAQTRARAQILFQDLPDTARVVASSLLGTETPDHPPPF